MTGFRVAYGGGAGSLRDHARPDGAGQGHRRRTARRGLRGIGHDHGPRLAGRADLPGRHALGQSPGHGRRPGHAALAPREPPYERLEALSARLAEGLDRAATDAGIPHVVQRVGSMLTLFFHDGPVHDYDDARRSDTRLFARFFWEMLARGVYLPCSQFEAAFVSRRTPRTTSIEPSKPPARLSGRAGVDRLCLGCSGLTVRFSRYLPHLSRKRCHDLRGVP